MSIVSKLFGLVLGTDPTNPGSNRRILYAKSDGWYDKNSAGVVSKLQSGTTEVLASGTYTPVASNLTDLVNLTMYQAQYMRVGSIVTVSGAFEAEVFDQLFKSTFDITLPIASNLASSEDLAGVCSGSQNIPTSGRILGNGGSSTASVSILGETGVDITYAYTFTYQII